MHRLWADRRSHRVRRRSPAQDQFAAQHEGCGAPMRHPSALKFVSSNRRVREDRRFVTGQGRFVADVPLDGLLHVAVLSSQYPAARIVSIDTAEAMNMPGVHYVLTGEELARATEPL